MNVSKKSDLVDTITLDNYKEVIDNIQPNDLDDSLKFFGVAKKSIAFVLNKSGMTITNMVKNPQKYKEDELKALMYYSKILMKNAYVRQQKALRELLETDNAPTLPEGLNLVK